MSNYETLGARYFPGELLGERTSLLQEDKNIMND